MNYKKTAQEIVLLIGGKENITHLDHCSTRLRFTLADSSKAQIKDLEKVDGVIGVRQNVQTQVIIGNEVIEVFDEIKALIGEPTGFTKVTKEKQKLGPLFLDFLIGVFQPLVPVLAGGGILRSLLSVVVMLGWLDGSSTTFEILNMIGQAPLDFLPILAAFTTAQKLKVNPIVAASAVSTLVLPDMIHLIEEGGTLFSLQIQNIEYFTQVFPAIMCVCFYALMEKWVTRISPKPIRIFFVPMVSLLITVPVTLLFLGPLGYNVGSIFATFVVAIYTRFGWIASAILGAILPLMIMTGMHKAMIPYAVSTYTSMGRELLYLPASLAQNISEAGACFAVYLKTKDRNLKTTALSGGISALCAISEPAIYGVTVLHKSVLIAVMISSSIGAAFIGLMQIDALALVAPSLISITMFVDPENPMNIVYALIAVVISFVLSFVLTFLLYKNPNDEAVDPNDETVKLKEAIFSSPVEGEVIPLEEIKDDVFSSGMLGRGVGIKPNDGVIYAPVEGEVTMIFETQHAIGMKTSDEAEILIHIGIDTVELKGTYFKSSVKVGDHVKVGQKLSQFDLAKIEKEGFDPTVVFVVTNHDDYEITTYNINKTVSKEDILIKAGKKTVLNDSIGTVLTS